MQIWMRYIPPMGRQMNGQYVCACVWVLVSFSEFRRMFWFFPEYYKFCLWHNRNIQLIKMRDLNSSPTERSAGLGFWRIWFTGWSIGSLEATRGWLQFIREAYCAMPLCVSPHQPTTKLPQMASILLAWRPFQHNCCDVDWQTNHPKNS